MRPLACRISLQISGMRCSKIPNVEGFVIISAATSSVTNSRSLSAASICPCDSGLIFSTRSRLTAVAGLVPWARSRDQDFLPRIALFFQVRANQEQPGHFALRARGGLQRDRVHPGYFKQAFFQQLKNLEAALR